MPSRTSHCARILASERLPPQNLPPIVLDNLSSVLQWILLDATLLQTRLHCHAEMHQGQCRRTLFASVYVSLCDTCSCIHSCTKYLPRRMQMFLGLLRRLRERHRGHLASGKSWQQSCARTADAACVALSQAMQRGKHTTSVAAIFLMAAVAGILAVYLARQEFVQVTACIRAMAWADSYIYSSSTTASRK